jgi:putative ABC transport system permease protein
MVGVIVLAPLLGLPIVKLLGAPFRAGFGTVGRLSTDNAERNPRRTAATASALMIGLALVSAFGVLAASISASIDDVVERQLGADYIVSNGAQMPFSDDVAKRAAAVEGVESVVRQRFASAKVNDDKVFALATDTKALTDAVKIEFVQGRRRGPHR